MAQQTSGGLDYRQHYNNQHPQQPVPYGNPPFPAYPGRPGGLFSNPLTGGQWLMIIGGAVAVGGLSYYAWVRYSQSKAKAQNPGQVRHLYPVQSHASQAAYPQAA